MRSTTTGGGFSGAVAAEWTKLVSLRGTWWCLASGLLLMAGASWILGIDARNPFGPVPVTEIALGSAQLAQFAIITLAMVVITGEYSSGAIRTSLCWVPRRTRLLLAKAAVVAPVMFVAGTLLWLTGLAAAWAALGERGHLDAAMIPGDVLSAGLYFAAAGVLTLSVGTALRSAAATLTSVFVLIMVAPMVLPGWIAHYLPGSAGRAILIGSGDPYGPVTASAVLIGWAVGALGAGALVLHRRDA